MLIFAKIGFHLFACLPYLLCEAGLGWVGVGVRVGGWGGGGLILTSNIFELGSNKLMYQNQLHMKLFWY